MISKETLLQQAALLDYKPEIYEKVQKLLWVLQQFAAVPYLKERIALKGGTALNLFYFDSLPRLSVDIDLNYIGSVVRSEMLKDKTILNEAMTQILQQNQFELDRAPNRHAGAKNIWRYKSALGQRGNLEIDLNYMYRKPLWPVIELEPKVMQNSDFKVPVLDIHELAAGKLTALFARKASRDFFDAHYLFSGSKLNITKLRESFVIYISCSNISLDALNLNRIDYDIVDIRNKLLPVLKQNDHPRKRHFIENWAMQLRNELIECLGVLLPLRQNEIDFIHTLQNQGEIRPDLITNDSGLIDIVLEHPLIKWKALQARESEN